MNGSIICGIDGSEESRSALRVAAHLADRLGLRLVMAHVHPEAAFVGGPEPQGALVTVTPEFSRIGEQLLERLAEQEAVPHAERRVLHGLPAERLADLADEEDAHLIVVGSRGRGAFKRAFLGSVSSDVIGLARRPVLVVPPGAGTAGGYLHASPGEEVR
jgi:nucleotide-binding universal stress UspA family protein